MIEFLLAAAVAFGSCTTNTASGSVTSITITGFAPSGSKVLLLASIAFQSNPSTVSGVTWGGNPMTLVSDNAIDNRGHSLWSLAIGDSPASSDVVFSMGDPFGANRIVASVCAFTGVDQVAPLGSPVTGTDYTGSPISITVPTDGLGFDASYDIDQTPAVGVQTAVGGTKRFEAWVDEGTSNTALFGSTRASTGTLGWTTPGGEYNGQIGVPINPSTATITILQRRPMVMQ